MAKPRSVQPRYPANRLRQLRERNRMSMDELAQATGTTASTVNKLEKQTMELTVEWARKLAPVLKCHWYELFDDAPTQPALDPEIQQMVEVFRELGAEDRKAVRRHADALKKPDAGSDRKNGSNGG